MTEAVRYGGTQLLIDGVSHAFGPRPILRDVHAEIKDILRPGQTQGQVVALLGPSGCGKTTLLHIIAGLLTPDAGRVLVPYDTMTFQEVERGLVGVVYQDYPLFEHRTLWGNLWVAANQCGTLQEREARLGPKGRALLMLDRFQLTPVMHNYPAELSGGQRQRAAIAQQLLCGEHLLLLDEPFSGLDPVMEEEVCALISELAAADDLNTVVVVTHDLVAAATVADHIWLMGWEHDAAGGRIPGAKIVETFDLIERDLCWHKDIALTPQFSSFIRELRARFRGL